MSKSLDPDEAQTVWTENQQKALKVKELTLVCVRVGRGGRYMKTVQRSMDLP